MGKIGRNDPCPCGSGKKYKFCCMECDVKGCLYICTFYPGYICLEEGSVYFCEIENKYVSFLINRHVNPLEILDFDNSIIENKLESLVKLSLKNKIEGISNNTVAISAASRLAKVIDYKKHDYRLFTPRYYTEIIISYEIESEKESNEDFTFSRKALDYFISNYRLVSKDAEIKKPTELFDDSLITKVCSIKYSNEELKLPIQERMKKERELNFGIKEVKYEKYGGSLPKIDREREMRLGRALLKSLNYDKEISIVEEMLIKAIEEFKDNKNYKYALLNAFTVAEVVISDFVYNEKLKKGVSKKKLDDYKGEIGVSYILNVELPLLTDIDDQARQIIGAIDKVRKDRNDIIHNGKSVSAEEAHFAINAVFKLLGFIDQKTYATLCGQY